MKATKAEAVDDRGRKTNGLCRFWQNGLTKWRAFRAKMRFSYQQMPEKKQMAVKLICLILAVTLLAIFFPKVYSFGLLIVACYLCWVIIKR